VNDESVEFPTPRSPSGGAPILVSRVWANRGQVTGYEQLVKHLPSKRRVMSGDRLRRPYRLFSWIGRRANGHERYTADSAGIEAAGLLALVRYRSRHIHFLYGEYDMHFSPAVCGFLRAGCTAAFHNPPAELSRRLPRTEFLNWLSGAVLLGGNQVDFFAAAAPEVPIRVIPHGVDTTFFSPDDDGRDSVSKNPTVLIVGVHLRDWPCTRDFLYALRSAIPRLQVRSVVPEEYRELLPRENWVVNEHPVTDDRLRHLYRQSTFLFYAPLDCVASNAVVEALACGLPIVAPSVGALPEYVPEGAGFLVNPGDLSVMTDAARVLCEDSDVQAASAVAARARGLALDWKGICRQHLEFFDRVVYEVT
jgi:glycosyltransferase involved in cell wall biosynthesis